MSKRTKKNNNYNDEALNALSEEFGVTKTFVRQCIRKEKNSLTAQTIEKKYKQLVIQSNKPIENFKNNPII